MRLATYIIGTVSCMLSVIGLLFKFQHWPGAGVVFTLGLGLFGLVFIPLYAVYRYHKFK